MWLQEEGSGGREKCLEIVVGDLVGEEKFCEYVEGQWKSPGM